MPKWTASHTFQVVIGAVMAVLTFLSTDSTLGPYAKPALGILTALLTYLGLSSGKAFGRPSGGAGAAAILMLCVGLPLGSTACAPAAPAVAPAASCVSAVIADAVAGLTIPEIVAKEQGPCIQDAEQVIALLIGSLADHPELANTPAMKSALALRGH